jgi:hypothetical protein
MTISIKWWEWLPLSVLVWGRDKDGWRELRREYRIPGARWIMRHIWRIEE